MFKCSGYIIFYVWVHTVDVEVDRGTVVGLYPVAGSHLVSAGVITLRPGNGVASGDTDRLLRH